jgi:hypothetical protein
MTEIWKAAERNQGIVAASAAEFGDLMRALSPEQRAQIRSGAEPIPYALRQAFLARVCEQLSGRAFSNGDLMAAIAVAQQQLLLTRACDL